MSLAYPAIVCTENMLSGSPRIDGWRLAVGDVVIIVNDSLDHALNSHELSFDQIKQALNYCATLQCKSDNPPMFCHNCSLRNTQKGPLDTSGLEEVTDGDSIFVRGENFIAFGSMQELLDDWNGYDWWIIATDLLIDLGPELRGEPARS